MSYEEAYKYVDDNLEVDFSTSLTRVQLTELYKGIYGMVPRSSLNKKDIMNDLKYFIRNMHRTEALSRGLDCC